ncbi:MAG: hypothetical protein HUJ68_12960, partial [Clostridia bacterium]|nr:hypothetical protein [Clostridia bacterium]
GFGDYTAKVITPKNGTTGEDRFYVMALQDHTPGTAYYWYYAANGKLDNAIPTTGDDSDDFGQGKENTNQMIEKWNEENSSYGAKNAGSNYTDLWGIFYDDNNKSGSINKEKDIWFVPSKGEWSAFGDCVFSIAGVTTSNYDNYSLRDWYWSSSQSDADGAYRADFRTGYMRLNLVSGGSCVRLSATF